MAIVSVGIDLAKNVFAVHGVDESGKPALVRPSVPRARLLNGTGSSPDSPAHRRSPDPYEQVCGPATDLTLALIQLQRIDQFHGRVEPHPFA